MNPITKQYEWIQQWGNTIEEEEQSVSEVLGKDEGQEEDHVLVHGNEGGQRVQPNLRRSSVATMIWIFREANR